MSSYYMRSHILGFVPLSETRLRQNLATIFDHVYMPINRKYREKARYFYGGRRVTVDLDAQFQDSYVDILRDVLMNLTREERELLSTQGVDDLDSVIYETTIWFTSLDRETIKSNNITQEYRNRLKEAAGGVRRLIIRLLETQRDDYTAILRELFPLEPGEAI